VSEPRKRRRAALTVAGLTTAGVLLALFGCWDTDEQAGRPRGAAASPSVSAPRTSPQPAVKSPPNPQLDPARHAAPSAPDPLPVEPPPVEPAPSDALAPQREVLVRLVDTQGSPASGANLVLLPNGPRFQDPNPDRRRRKIQRARREFPELLPAQPGHSRFSVPSYHADAEGRILFRPPPTVSRWKIDSQLWPELNSWFEVPPDTWLDLGSAADEVVLTVWRKPQLTFVFPDLPGAPQPGDWVKVRGDVPRIESRIRPDRSATVLVGPGALELEVVHTGSGRSWTRELRLEPGAEETLTLDPTGPGVTAAGVVLGEAGPLEGALVRPLRWGPHVPLHGIEVESAPPAGARTDASGRFVLVGDRAPAELRISADGYRPQKVSPAPGLRVTLEREPPPRELVVLLAHAPSGTVNCTLTRIDGRGSVQLRTGSATPTFTDLRPGRYRLVVAVDGEQPRPAVTVEVRLDPPRVEVHVP